MTARHPLIPSFLFGFAILAPGALAQKGDSRVTGHVVDVTSGARLPRVEILFLGDMRSVVSDSAGGYVFDDLPSGILRFAVRTAGFPAQNVVVALAKHESMARVIEMDSTAAGRAAAAQSLPLVAVTAAPSRGPRYADFERRQRTGRGQYLTREEIDKAGYGTLQDAVRGMRGVNVECGGGLGCYIRMASAPMQCMPEYIIDGYVNNSFGRQTPIRDIEAMEVYTGPSEIPGEFAGRNAGCGAVVIWTRSGPPRRKP